MAIVKAATASIEASSSNSKTPESIASDLGRNLPKTNATAQNPPTKTNTEQNKGRE